MAGSELPEFIEQGIQPPIPQALGARKTGWQNAAGDGMQSAEQAENRHVEIRGAIAIELIEETILYCLVKTCLLLGKTAQNTAILFRRQLQTIFLADLIYIGGYGAAHSIKADAFNRKRLLSVLKLGKSTLKGMP